MKKTEYKNIGESLYSCTLENGLEIRLVPKKDFATKYAVFAANYGGAHRRFTVDGQMTDTPAGVAHFLEHKMFDLPNGDNALSLLTANGADPNAFTSPGITAYHFQCTDKFEQNLELLLRFVSTPYFTEETVNKEQGIIAQEIRMGEDSPGAALYYNLLGLLYKHHPIKDRVAGTVESIGHITAQTLYDCHRVFYAPSNMVLCVAGDVEPETVESIARKLLPPEKSPIPAADFGEMEGPLPVNKLRREKMEVAAAEFLIGAKLPAYTGEDALKRRLVAGLAMKLLCGASSDFFNKLYAEGLLNNSFDYEIDFCAGTGTLILGGESRDCDEVLRRFIAEAERVGREGFEEKRFARAKKSSFGAKLRGLEDFDGLCVALAEGHFDGCCPLDSFRLLDSVSAEDCRLFVQKYLAEERLAMSVIEPNQQ